MENLPIVTYRELLRTEIFARRHLAVSLDEAYFLSKRRNIHRQTFFIVNFDTEFFVLPNGYIISSQSLEKIDITARGCERRWDTFCIWNKDKDPHYEHHLWDWFNFDLSGSLPERIRKLQ